MGKYEGILICTDFDGTLADRAQISQGNIDAVRAFQEEGGMFTIASGRSPEFLFGMRGKLHLNAPVVSINGTMINDPDDMRILWESPLDEGALNALEELAVFTETETMIVYSPADDSVRWNRGSGASVAETFAAVPKPWYKALLIQDAAKTPAVLAAASERYAGKYTFDCSWPMGIELHQSGTGKGECLPVLKRLLDGRVRLTVGVGDYDNDISLLRCADIGYAVANATDAVKRAADRVTVANTEDAIARIIAELG